MDTKTYLKSEIERLQKSTITNYVIGTILSLIVIGYTICGLWMVGLFTNPAQLSDSLIYKARKEGPVAIVKLERHLEQKAPDLANGLSFSIQKLIPQIRYSLQSDVDTMLARNLDSMRKALDDMTGAWLVAHKDEIGQKAQDETPEAYANKVASVLCRNFSENLDLYLNESMGTSMDDMASKSEYILNNLDKHFDRLSKVHGKKMTRSDQLERFLVGYVINTYMGDLQQSK